MMTDSARLIFPIYKEEGEYDKLTTPMEGETGCDCA